MKVEATDIHRWEEPGARPTERAGAAIRKAKPSRTLPSSVKRFRFLTADGQTATALEQEALLGTNDLVEASFLDRCRLVMDCIGRLRFPTPRGRAFATGFLIAPGLVMTNHHVFPDEQAARGASLEFGYRYDIAGSLPSFSEEFALDPAAFFVSDKDLDFAVVAVAPRSSSDADIVARGYLRLIAESGKATKGDFVSIIQHPDGAPMQIALRENEVIRAETEEAFLWYQADTAHGSSGAPVFNDSFQIVALHSSGRISRNAEGLYAKTDGTWVASLEGLSESDVVWEANVGFRVSRICKALPQLAQTRSPRHADLITQAMQGGDVLAKAVERAKSGIAEREVKEETRPADMAEVERTAKKMPPSTPAKPNELIIPLQIRISVEMAGAGVTTQLADAKATDATTLEFERFEMRIPVIYDGLEERPGFDRRFLDDAEDAPMPKLTPAGEGVSAPLLSGAGNELRYKHFSVWMQRERRLALFTAANVNWLARRRIVDGRSTDRKSLAGFPPDSRIAEQWANDARLDAAHQLPDTFYTEDRGAFDKGHLTRRDDVCWGERFEEIQMANGDTFHVTNCSPQIKAFNQGPAGEDNWGDLETHIQNATKRDVEKAITYAGPIFGRDDRWFSGTTDTGALRVQIPARYWKIVLVKSDGEYQAYGFVLKQDVLRITEAEFYVTEEWIGALTRLSEIESLLRGWISLEALVPYDRYDEARAGLTS